MRRGLVFGVDLAAAGASTLAEADEAIDSACPAGKDLDAATLKGITARAVFQVIVKDLQGNSIRNGTATLIDSRGYFLTAAHVVDGYATPGTDTVELVQDRGAKLTAVVKESFGHSRLDVAILKTQPVGEMVAKPVSLRISSPLAKGAPLSGWVVAYRSGSGILDNPLPISIVGSADEPDSMIIKFTAVGGNSGSLLLEPSGRGFGILTEGPDPQKLELELIAPEVEAVVRNGHATVPERPVSVLSDDVLKIADSIQKSKAISVSSFWDRLAASIPPSPLVQEALDDLPKHGWDNVLPILIGSDSRSFTAIDAVHFFQNIGNDAKLRQIGISGLASVMPIIAKTCAVDAYTSYVLGASPRALAKSVLQESVDSKTGGALLASANTILTYEAQKLARSDSADAEKLTALVSDLAEIRFKQALRGEGSLGNVVNAVALAEGFGGTPVTAEMAALLANRNGDPKAAASFFALADARLRTSTKAGSVEVNERRKTISRIYNKVGGEGVFGTSVASVPAEQAQSILRTGVSSPIARTLTMFPDASAAAVALQNPAQSGVGGQF